MFDKKTVFLIVEDFEVMRKVTASQLRSLGAERIVFANNGAEALHTLRKQRIDVVLSDWNMPVMSGLDLLKAMREDERLRSLPFVMITAEADRERIREAITLGVGDLLVKPYTSQRLLEAVDKVTAWKHRRLPAAPTLTILRDALPATAATAQAAAAPAAPAPADARPAARETQQPIILVVDDSPDNLLLLSRLFTDDYRVRVALNGEKALSVCCSDTPPDLVLLDVMMPGMDGFEVARRMREHPSSMHIPVIFVTAMSGEQARIQGLELGAVDFVSKPVDPDELQLRVRNFMQYVALRKNLQADYDAMLALARLRDDVEHITRHDMKGPLAAILGLVRSLAESEGLGHRQKEQLGLVEDTTLQLLEMSNLSSELFRIESGRFQLDARPVPVGDMLRRIVALARVSFAAKHLALVVDTDVDIGKEPPQALGDAMLCQSIFQNLIKNACEAAPEGSRVLVTLHHAQDPLRIAILNRGAVPAAIREHFFDKFITAGKPGGTGLGTYSARLLTEAQHGHIELQVDDASDRTLVTVVLPRYNPAPA